MDADPGRQFASDVQRRVTAHLPVPDDAPTPPTALLLRLDGDPHTPISVREGEAALSETLAGVLSELAAAGLAEEVDGAGWRMTAAGFEKLTGPALTTSVPGPDGEPVPAEPPDLEGPRLAAAEALDAALAEEEAAGEKAAALERVERAKADLAEAEADLAEVGK